MAILVEWGAKRDRVVAVAFGDVALGEHAGLDRGVGGVAVVGVGAVVPEPVHGDPSVGTGAGGVGQRHRERVAGLELVPAVARIGPDLRGDRAAFALARREE